MVSDLLGSVEETAYFVVASSFGSFSYQKDYNIFFSVILTSGPFSVLLFICLVRVVHPACFVVIKKNIFQHILLECLNAATRMPQNFIFIMWHGPSKVQNGWMIFAQYFCLLLRTNGRAVCTWERLSEVFVQQSSDDKSMSSKPWMSLWTQTEWH